MKYLLAICLLVVGGFVVGAGLVGPRPDLFSPPRSLQSEFDAISRDMAEMNVSLEDLARDMAETNTSLSHRTNCIRSSAMSREDVKRAVELWGDAKRATRGTRIEPETLLALAWVESRLDHRARSSVGARGIVQMMPGTMRGYGVTPRCSIARHFRAAALYLDDLLLKYREEMAPALGAYLTGPGHMSLKRGDVRCYVHRVMWYSSLLRIAGTPHPD